MHDPYSDPRSHGGVDVARGAFRAAGVGGPTG
jgi:hypothetical protein